MADVVKILLVDDEPRNLDTLEAILDTAGYTLLRAADADTALKALLEHDVAAIVLDIKMPGVSGFELAQLIKGTRRFRQIPIVFLTAYMIDAKDVLLGYGAGAVDYLTKPVDPQILRHKIGVFADLFRKTRALAELNDTLEARVQERTAELERSEAALRAAAAQKDRFLATLAHELRNPLAPLRTGLDILLQKPGPELEARAVAAMNRQLDHMVRLVDDLLDVARISRGTIEMRKESARLAHALERAVEIVQPALAARKQQVTLAADPGLVGTIDVTRVSQIVANLLHNASKHSAVGARVSLELAREGQMATVRVVDEGAGIPTDQLERVFELFTRIERESKTTADGGLGIGLALSRQLAELHGGSLSVESAGEGRGATFTLRLPADPVAMAEAQPPPAKEQPRPESGLRIVLAEDNEDSAEMMSAWLTRLGHEVLLAAGGPEAVALVIATQPDVVLCDIGLPDLDGVEVCRQVMATLTKRPIMIALTGWGMEGDRKRTAEAGFAHHFVKPVQPDALRELLNSIPRAAAPRARES